MPTTPDDKSALAAPPVRAEGNGSASSCEERSADADSLLGQVAGEYFERLSCGERPDIEAYAARHPQIAGLIRKALPALQLLGDSQSAAAGVLDEDLSGHEPLGDYRLLREIGRGGMGVVYEAEQLSLKRKVALKVLPFAAVLDPRHVQRFRNEALAAAQLEHPHIVPVYGVGCERGVHHYAMRYIEGQTLADVITELRRANGLEQNAPAAGPMSRIVEEFVSGPHAPPSAALQPTVVGERGSTVVPAAGQKRPTALAGRSPEGSTTSREFFRSVATLGRDVARALDYAHEHGVVHRDIKPSNLMLDGAGKAWVTDFGLAHIESDVSLTMSGDLLGTLRYMSPEQILAKRVVIDHRTDVYSLGVTLYELLTLQPAFPETDRQALLHHIAFDDPAAPRRLNPRLPVDLETIILKATAKNPNERYETSQALADDLQRFLHHEPIRARRPTLIQRAAKWSRRHPAILWSTTIVLCVATLALIVSTAMILHAFKAEQSARVSETEARKDAQRQTALAKEHAKSALEARTEAEGQTSLALQERNVARLHQYNAEIMSGQADWQRGNIGSLHRKLVGHLPVDGEEDRRGWEWYYLFSLCRPEERAMVRCFRYPVASWSPDGEYIAVGGTVWNARSGECVREFSPSRILRHRVAWSPDGRKLAWGKVEDDNKIYIWDRQTDRIKSLRGHESSVWCVAWSPDGTKLSSGSMDGTVRIWDMRRGTTMQTLSVEHYVTGVAWSPDGELLAVGVEENGVKIWNLTRDKLIADHKEANGRVQVSWHPDGGQLAVCTGEKWYLMDSTDWSVIREQQHTPSGGRDIAWNPDGTRLAVAHGEVATIWDPAADQPVATLHGHLRPIISVGWSPDGSRLVTSDTIEEVRIWDWDLPIQPLPFSTAGSLASLDWMTDGKTLATVSAEDHCVSFWDVTKGGRIKVEQPPSDRPVLWSPDRRLLAVRTGTDEEPAIHILNAGTGAVHSVWPGAAEHRLHMFVWSPDASKLAIQTTFDGHIDLVFWDVDREQTISNWTKKLRHDRDLLESIWWADDSSRVAAIANGDVGDNGAVVHIYHAHIVDVARGVRIVKHKLGAYEHQGDVTAVAWNPGGDLLACGGSEGLFEVIDVDAGKVRFSTKPHNAPIQSLAWSPDGRRVASTSNEGTVKVLAAQDGAELLQFAFEEDLPTRVAWSPDLRRLAVATEDGTIHVWDASRAYEFCVDGSRRGELAWLYYQRGISNGQRADELALREFLRLAPDTLGYWPERGNAYAMLGEFDRAAQEFAKAIGPDVGLSFMPAWNRALALLGTGKLEVYEEFCASLIEKFANSQVPSNQNYVAWLCTLSPNSHVDSAQVLRISRALHDYGSAEDYGDFKNLVIGASLCRNEHYDQAVSTLTTLTDKLDRGGDAIDLYELACAHYFISMARHQLGHGFQASRHLASAKRQSDAYRKVGNSWSCLVILDALQRETEAALSEPVAASGKSGSTIHATRR